VPFGEVKIAKGWYSIPPEILSGRYTHQIALRQLFTILPRTEENGNESVAGKDFSYRMLIELVSSDGLAEQEAQLQTQRIPVGVYYTAS
jgi:hypothetical protein